MKSNINNLFQPISKESLIALTTEVKETVAEVNNSRSFKAVDLWKIQSSTRKFATRSRQILGA
ncbi:MAG TPA: hypothetical protein PLQ32_12405 [Flavihumibacter sp.]|nr:hypothetical protein [Bacteroidota bacterium]HOA39221.1 hypothetical protein [Flavihumibacter sp.]HPZ88904.1 hypothetical protein [Flavihumibacter sp.]HQD10058.1 hypothetical protein [Flavihumibacter sp.]